MRALALFEYFSYDLTTDIFFKCTRTMREVCECDLCSRGMKSIYSVVSALKWMCCVCCYWSLLSCQREQMQIRCSKSMTIRWVTLKGKQTETRKEIKTATHSHTYGPYSYISFHRHHYDMSIEHSCGFAECILCSVCLACAQCIWLWKISIRVSCKGAKVKWKTTATKMGTWLLCNTGSSAAFFYESKYYIHINYVNVFQIAIAP